MAGPLAYADWWFRIYGPALVVEALLAAKRDYVRGLYSEAPSIGSWHVFRCDRWLDHSGPGLCLEGKGSVYVKGLPPKMFRAYSAGLLIPDEDFPRVVQCFCRGRDEYKAGPMVAQFMKAAEEMAGLGADLALDTDVGCGTKNLGNTEHSLWFSLSLNHADMTAAMPDYKEYPIRSLESFIGK